MQYFADAFLTVEHDQFIPQLTSNEQVFEQKPFCVSLPRKRHIPLSHSLFP